MVALDKNQLPTNAISVVITEIPLSVKPSNKSLLAPYELINWRGDVSMNPASTMKILTTLAALDVLGPKYRWRTLIYTDGVIRNGILKKFISARHR